MLQFAQIVGQYFWLPIPLTILHGWWCLFFAYPLYLDARIRDGKSWIYLPVSWKSGNRPLIYPLTLSSFCLTATFWSVAVYYFSPWGYPWLISLAFLAGFLLFILQRFLLRFRFVQQQEIYFQIYKRIANQYHREGKPHQETDIRNRCAWEFQNSLRRADRGGRLLRYLNLRSKNARKGLESKEEEF